MPKDCSERHLEASLRLTGWDPLILQGVRYHKPGTEVNGKTKKFAERPGKSFGAARGGEAGRIANSRRMVLPL